MNEIEKCIATLSAWTQKLQEMRVGGWLRAELNVLPKWKRQPRSFRTLPSGEVVVYGQAHTVRTTYLRSQYTMADVAFLRRVIEAPDPITALNQYEARQAGRILRAKRRPVEAEPDVMDSSWGKRVERHMTPEDLVRAQLSGRALAKELRRIGKL